MSSLLPLHLVFGLASLGGWLLAASLFRLRRGEIAIAGLAFGLLIQNWLTNILAHWLDLSLAARLSSVIVLLAGALAAWRTRSFTQLAAIPAAWRLWILFAFLALVFYGTGRGLGLLDDYQNLPVTSMLATGDIPPHFPLDPSLRFGYHYFLLLFAAQIMRLGATFPWIALDAARALTISLNLVLAGLWAWRVTRRRLAALAAGLLFAFASGTRWILLLLPAPLLNAVSARVALIGSSSELASDMAHALLLPWQVDGAGPVPFPFAFISGVNPPLVMAYGGGGAVGGLIILLLLLTGARWRHWTAAIPTTIVLASYALANDAGYGVLGLGFALAVFVWVVRNRSLKLPRQLWVWLAMLVVSLLIALVQGGMFTELVASRLDGANKSYFSVRAALTFPPVIVSGHFGALSLGNPTQLFVAFLETGPLILLLPLVLWLGLKSLRRGRWYEAALIATAALAVPAAFVVLEGRDLSATARFQSGLFFTTTLYAAPLLWFWARKRSDGWKITLLSGGLVSIFAGLVLFGTQLPAIQKPVYAPFLNQLDAQVAHEYWNKLEPGALVFDSYPPRTPVVFGRFTLAAQTWYLLTPEWFQLRDTLTPHLARLAGFDYIYMDAEYWSRLTDEQKDALRASCVKTLFEVQGVHSDDDPAKDFRRLYDIRACE